MLGQWGHREWWDHKGEERRIQQPNILSPVHIDVLQFSPGLLALAGTAEYARHRQHLRGSPYHLHTLHDQSTVALQQAELWNKKKLKSKH